MMAYHVLDTFLLISNGFEKTPSPACFAYWTYSVGVHSGGSSMPSSNIISMLTLGDRGALTFNRLDICLHLRTRQPLRLEPICNDQFSPWVQQSRGVPEEELLIRQMTHRLRDPHAIKSHRVGRSAEVVSHFLGVLFHVADLSTSQLGKPSLVDLPMVGAGFLCRHFFCYLHLATTYGKPDDLASMFCGQIAGRAAYATSHIQDVATSGQIGPF